MSFHTNNTERMTIDSSGFVGIANDTPSDFHSNARNLVIGNSSGNSGMTFRCGTSDAGSIFFADGTSGSAEAEGFIQESDIVLSDIKLGKENGIEFLEELRSQGVDKPFLMMSGAFSKEEGMKTLELTGHPVIQKPPSPDELLRFVNKVIH